MSQIMINDTETVEGSFTYEVTVDETKHPPIYSIDGIFSTRDKYIAKLVTLQNEKYRLEGIRVYRETYGSEDDAVVYHFTAARYSEDFDIDKMSFTDKVLLNEIIGLDIMLERCRALMSGVKNFLDSVVKNNKKVTQELFDDTMSKKMLGNPILRETNVAVAGVGGTLGIAGLANVFD